MSISWQKISTTPVTQIVLTKKRASVGTAVLIATTSHIQTTAVAQVHGFNRSTSCRYRKYDPIAVHICLLTAEWNLHFNSPLSPYVQEDQSTISHALTTPPPEYIHKTPQVCEKNILFHKTIVVVLIDQTCFQILQKYTCMAFMKHNMAEAMSLSFTIRTIKPYYHWHLCLLDN